MIQKLILTNTDSLIPYAGNSRTHSDEQVQQIAASIKEFGFNNPVLIDEANGIIAGHGRVLAAAKLQLKEVPTICLKHLSDAQRRAYIIADNKLALNAEWDENALAIEIDRLLEDEFNLDVLGFSGNDLNFIDSDFEPKSSAEEINVDEFDLDHKCPKCGFEYND